MAKKKSKKKTLSKREFILLLIFVVAYGLYSWYQHLC